MECMNIVDMLIIQLSEKNLDEVMQIPKVFINVSKGEVAKKEELQKVFNTEDQKKIVETVTLKTKFTCIDFNTRWITNFCQGTWTNVWKHVQGYCHHCGQQVY